MKDFHVAPTPCPYCRASNQCHAEPGGRTPKTDDLSVCWECGKPAIFVVDLFGTRLRKPTAEEAADLKADPMYVEMMRARTGAPDPLTAMRRYRNT